LRKRIDVIVQQRLSGTTTDVRDKFFAVVRTRKTGGERDAFRRC